MSRAEPLLGAAARGVPEQLSRASGPTFALKLKSQRLILHQDWDFLSCVY